MRKLIATVLAAALLAAVLGSAASAGRATSAGAGVNVGDFFLSPTHVSIRKGRTVTWRWVGGSSEHRIAGSGFHSRTQASGSYSHRFARAGTFRVICSIHPTLMRMTVTVR